MPRKLLALLLLLPALAFAQATLSADEAAKVEKAMSEWLAHPNEFGVKPKRTKYRATVETAVPGTRDPLPVHIVEYEMPDGTYGRGFANPVTWSFTGAVQYDKLTDTDLATAYSGWLWVAQAMRRRLAETEFNPQTLDTMLATLTGEGVTRLVVKDQIRVQEVEMFEFTGVRDGMRIKGAGSAETQLILDAAAPQASLPVIYTYLGLLMRGGSR